MFVKIHKTYRDVVAVCDSELIGKRYEQNKFQLDVKESFYREEIIKEQELIDLLVDLSKEDATFNIVGEKSIACALKAGIINKHGIGRIAGIPYALILV